MQTILLKFWAVRFFIRAFGIGIKVSLKFTKSFVWGRNVGIPPTGTNMANNKNNLIIIIN